LDARDVRGLLRQLEDQFPKVYQEICDETGAVLRHVNLFINEDNMRDRDGQDTPLASGDTVTILPAVSGG